MDGFEGPDLNVWVARCLDVPQVRVVSSQVEPLDFPVANMTTSGIFRVSGRAQAGSDSRAFSMIIKVVQSASRWPLISVVPPDLRRVLVDGYPWRTEPEVYRSDVTRCLPDGLRMPQVVAVVDLDEDSAAIWMEDVAEDSAAVWDVRRYRHAAHLLGLFAAHPDLPRIDSMIDGLKPTEGARLFVLGPVRHVFVPALQSIDFWQQPVIAAVIDHELQADLLRMIEELDDLVDELCGLPALPAHGDASPQNLIIEGESFVMIDWGSHGLAPVGHDLAQLLAGRINEGLLRGADLAELVDPCLAGYVDGLRQQGCEVPDLVVRRGFVLSMTIFSSMSALVSDKLDGPDTPALRHLMRGRAEMARFLMDLLSATS